MANPTLPHFKRSDLVLQQIRSSHPDWQFPDFSLTEFAPKRTKHCVIIVVVNEEERFRRQLGAMKARAHMADIIIADGGTTDGSTDHDFLKSCGARAILVIDPNPEEAGYGSQFRMSVAWAMHQGYEGVIAVDGNDKDDIAALELFLNALEEGYDLVQGSRFLKGARHDNTPPDRYYAIRLIHAPIMRLSGFRFTDSTNGFRAFSRNMLLDARISFFRSVFKRYNLQYYLISRAARLRMRLKEVPVSRCYPPAGPTPSKIKGVWARVRLMAALVLSVFGYYDPSSRHD